MEQLLNSYKLELLDGALLDGLFHARRLWGFMLREGTTLAVEQKKFEETLTSEEPNEMVAMAPGDEGEVVDEGAVSEEEGEERDEAQADEGFFYREDEEEVRDDKEMGIGARVAARRQGCLHSGGGQME